MTTKLLLLPYGDDIDYTVWREREKNESDRLNNQQVDTPLLNIQFFLFQTVYKICTSPFDYYFHSIMFITKC
jgi:hypothetical protein